MAKRVSAVPAKLKNDAIVEALVELRFDLPVEGIPEISFIRLAENPAWKGFQQRMMPVFYLPPQVRASDINLRYQPALELLAPDAQQTVRIGPQVLSYHRLAPYVGWEKFQAEVNGTVYWLFSQFPKTTVQRLGVRYMNALRGDVHRIKSVLDLDIELKVAGNRIEGNVNVNFTKTVDNDSACTVRIATPEFIQAQGKIPENTSVYVDVDVFTKEGFNTDSRETVLTWINDAHTSEKENFFRLLTEQTISELKER
jgi:uncharacterized protein (TIGR04255 family)